MLSWAVNFTDLYDNHRCCFEHFLCSFFTSESLWISRIVVVVDGDTASRKIPEWLNRHSWHLWMGYSLVESVVCYWSKNWSWQRHCWSWSFCRSNCILWWFFFVLSINWKFFCALCLVENCIELLLFLLCQKIQKINLKVQWNVFSRLSLWWGDLFWEFSLAFQVVLWLDFFIQSIWHLLLLVVTGLFCISFNCGFAEMSWHRDDMVAFKVSIIQALNAGASHTMVGVDLWQLGISWKGFHELSKWVSANGNCVKPGLFIQESSRFLWALPECIILWIQPGDIQLEIVYRAHIVFWNRKAISRINLWETWWFCFFTVFRQTGLKMILTDEYCWQMIFTRSLIDLALIGMWCTVLSVVLVHFINSLVDVFLSRGISFQCKSVVFHCVQVFSPSTAQKVHYWEHHTLLQLLGIDDACGVCFLVEIIAKSTKIFIRNWLKILCCSMSFSASFCCNTAENLIGSEESFTWNDVQTSLFLEVSV